MGQVVEFKKRLPEFKKLNVQFDPPVKRPDAQVAHLLSQRGQGYGSQSRKCYHCGVMLPSPGRAYTDDEDVWEGLKNDPTWIRCTDQPR